MRWSQFTARIFWPQDRQENSSEDWQSPRVEEAELGVQRYQASRVHQALSTASGAWQQKQGSGGDSED